MKVCLTKKHSLKGHPELPSDFQVLESLKGQAAFKHEYLKKHYVPKMPFGDLICPGGALKVDIAICLLVCVDITDLNSNQQ